MRKIDLYTFGESKSDKVLAEDLYKLGDYETKKAVGRILDRLNSYLKNIEVTERHTKGFLYKLFREYYIKRIDRPQINRHPKIKAFLATSITGKSGISLNK